MSSTEPKLSFARDIRPMFTDMDVEHMNKMINLTDRDAVFDNARAIYTSVAKGTMPPPNSGGARWTAEMCEKFRLWHAQGGPP